MIDLGWYDPRIARFASADTIVPDAGNPQDLNRYSYVRNNPVKYTDPTGHTPYLDAGGGGGASTATISPIDILRQCRGSLTCEWTEGGQWLLAHPSYDPSADPWFGQHEGYQNILHMLAQIYLDSGQTETAIYYWSMAQGNVVDQAIVDSSLSLSQSGPILFGTIISINPATLRWTQRTAGGRGRSAVLRRSLIQNGWNGDPIDVVQTADGMVTVDHTRAAIALELGMDSIPVRVHKPADLLPVDMTKRFRSPDGKYATTWGEAIEYRSASQRPPLPPTGTTKIPLLPD